MSSRWLKVLLLAAPLVAAGYFFGIVCPRMGEAYPLLLSPSRELLLLLLRLLLALAFVAVTAGIVAALVRPLWVSYIAFAVSGVALLLGWTVTAYSAVAVLLFVLVGAAYAVATKGELEHRITFSVRPVSEGQSALLAALLIVALASFYFGCAEHLKRAGFQIPERFLGLFTEAMAQRVAAQAPPAQRAAVLAEAVQQSRSMVDELLGQRLEPFEPFIPLALSVSLFMSLWSVTRLLTWVPMLILSAVFPLLTAVGITGETSETVEARRLVIT
jgi:hypothetical protein